MPTDSAQNGKEVEVQPTFLDHPDQADETSKLPIFVLRETFSQRYEDENGVGSLDALLAKHAPLTFLAPPSTGGDRQPQ